MNNKGIANFPCLYTAFLDCFPDTLAAHFKVFCRLTQAE